ncbi:MAG: hypothetical protein H6702_06975 [Myxococcales bacterium]|nr:hypothetical protein [Myxococcales bacterium]
METAASEGATGTIAAQQAACAGRSEAHRLGVPTTVRWCIQNRVSAVLIHLTVALDLDLALKRTTTS